MRGNDDAWNRPGCRWTNNTARRNFTDQSWRRTGTYMQLNVSFVLYIWFQKGSFSGCIYQLSLRPTPSIDLCSAVELRSSDHVQHFAVLFYWWIGGFLWDVSGLFAHNLLIHSCIPAIKFIPSTANNPIASVFAMCYLIRILTVT